MSCANLQLMAIIGFDGFVAHGLCVHPDGAHIIYPLGNKVCVQTLGSKQQRFLCGHTDAVSAVAVSPNGSYVAGGQVNYMGFKATVIVWNFSSCQIVTSHDLHKSRVESITFSCDSRYCISLGGRDDSVIAVWDLKDNKPMCGHGASPGIGGDALCVMRCNKRSVCFVSAGDNTLRIWRISPCQRILCGMDIKIGKIKRTILCLAVDCNDSFLYCGTTTGDILKINLNFHCDTSIEDPFSPPSLVGSYAKIPKKKNLRGDQSERYSLGVTAIVLLPNDPCYVVGTGDGTVEMVKECSAPIGCPPGCLRVPSLPRICCVKKAKLCAGITSMARMCGCLVAGTKKCEIFTICLKTFTVELHITCHTHAVYDVAFPCDFGGAFATSSKHDIRVWSTSSCKELLRITVPNFTCSTVIFSHNGKAILSGWNDGVIRAFTPQTGKLMFALHNAHHKGVNAIQITSCDRKLVSGGAEGEVRFWDIKPSMQTLLCVHKMHKGPVTAVDISCCDTEAISSSSDGSCIIWDLCRLMSRMIVFRDTQFTCARFFPTGVQFLSVGTDRRVGFWEVLDGALVREIEGSNCDSLNTVAIAHSGCAFVTGGNDQCVKLWGYGGGTISHAGVGHAGAITGSAFSPDDQIIVTVSADGAVFIWRSPCSCTPCPVNKCKPNKGCGDCKNAKEDIAKSTDNSPLSYANYTSPKEEKPAQAT